ncbi:hypothetical protein SNEBB_003805 [Seison nebaliae]|nr:hypothetical protein SNEBB_003805 [Seison nebaliae]
MSRSRTYIYSTAKSSNYNSDENYSILSDNTSTIYDTVAYDIGRKDNLPMNDYYGTSKRRNKLSSSTSSLSSSSSNFRYSSPLSANRSMTYTRHIPVDFSNMSSQTTYYDISGDLDNSYPLTLSHPSLLPKRTYEKPDHYSYDLNNNLPTLPNYQQPLYNKNHQYHSNHQQTVNNHSHQPQYNQQQFQSNNSYPNYQQNVPPPSSITNYQQHQYYPNNSSSIMEDKNIYRRKMKTGHHRNDNKRTETVTGYRIVSHPRGRAVDLHENWVKSRKPSLPPEFYANMRNRLMEQKGK